MRLLVPSLLVLRVLRLPMGRSHAYLDPGSGSMILQILLGGVAGLAVALRLSWHRISGVLRFGRRQGGEIATDDE